MKFAIELENKALEFYKKNNDNSEDQIIIEFQKRIKRLKRLRHENTTEMILEPIVDFGSNNYEICDEDTFVSSVKRVVMFYEIASKKTEFIVEVSNLLEKFSKKYSQMLG